MTQTFRSLIDRGANAFPNRTYLVDPDSKLTLSYRKLKEKSVQFGNLLDSLELSHSPRVGFLMDNGYWTIVVMMGTMYSGSVTVPLNVVASPGNLRFAVENAKVDVLFVSKEHRQLLAKILSGVERSIPVIEVDMEQGFELDLSNFSSVELPKNKLTGDSPAMILHTSGTVGMPKGAVLTHGNLIAGGNNVVLAQNLTKDDIAFCILPLYHINGQVVTAFAPLASGSHVVMPRKFSLSKFWPTLREFKCTWFSTVPTITKYLLDDVHAFGGEQQLKDSCTLRFARSASSAMPASMLLDFEETFGVPMLESMGLTEAAAPILANPMPPAVRKAGSVGIPFGTEVRIIDNSGRTRGPEETGEIVVRGANVISEYYNAPEATANSFTSDGWFQTGDLGYYDDDGYFFVTGRIKELIIKGGENISPREIDDVLYRNTAVLEAASFGYPDDTYGQVVAVAVVLKDGVSCTAEELMEYCGAQLGSFRCPSKIFFVDDLPKGPSGKIQRLEVARSLVKES